MNYSNQTNIYIVEQITYNNQVQTARDYPEDEYEADDHRDGEVVETDHYVLPKNSDAIIDRITYRVCKLNEKRKALNLQNLFPNL